MTSFEWVDRTCNSDYEMQSDLQVYRHRHRPPGHTLIEHDVPMAIVEEKRRGGIVDVLRCTVRQLAAAIFLCSLTKIEI